MIGPEVASKNSPTWAGKLLDDWCRQTMRSRLEPMKKIVRMLRSHRELILNYFKARKVISSGTVEGLNNKAKVTMRKSYGFRTFRFTERWPDENCRRNSAARRNCKNPEVPRPAVPCPAPGACRLRLHLPDGLNIA